MKTDRSKYIVGDFYHLLLKLPVLLIEHFQSKLRFHLRIGTSSTNS
jgi:hypothetical protein